MTAAESVAGLTLGFQDLCLLCLNATTTAEVSEATQLPFRPLADYLGLDPSKLFDVSSMSPEQDGSKIKQLQRFQLRLPICGRCSKHALDFNKKYAELTQLASKICGGIAEDGQDLKNRILRWAVVKKVGLLQEGFWDEIVEKGAAKNAFHEKAVRSNVQVASTSSASATPVPVMARADEDRASNPRAVDESDCDIDAVDGGCWNGEPSLKQTASEWSDSQTRMTSAPAQLRTEPDALKSNPSPENEKSAEAHQPRAFISQHGSQEQADADQSQPPLTEDPRQRWRPALELEPAQDHNATHPVLDSGYEEAAPSEIVEVLDDLISSLVRSRPPLPLFPFLEEPPIGVHGTSKVMKKCHYHPQCRFLCRADGDIKAHQLDSHPEHFFGESRKDGVSLQHFQWIISKLLFDEFIDEAGRRCNLCQGRFRICAPNMLQVKLHLIHHHMTQLERKLELLQTHPELEGEAEPGPSSSSTGGGSDPIQVKATASAQGPLRRSARVRKPTAKRQVLSDTDTDPYNDESEEEGRHSQSKRKKRSKRFKRAPTVRMEDRVGEGTSTDIAPDEAEEELVGHAESLCGCEMLPEPLCVSLDSNEDLAAAAVISGSRQQPVDEGMMGADEDEDNVQVKVEPGSRQIKVEVE